MAATPSDYCRIDLRHDQTQFNVESSSVEGIRIFAPTWIQEGLDILTKSLDGVGFEVHSFSNDLVHSTVIEKFRIHVGTFPVTLKKLQMIARCEPRNVTGFISKSHYAPANLSDEVVYAIRDLVRQTIVVGLDTTQQYGGYPDGKRFPQIEPVYIIDLSGLQFQQAYNTGRLVLIKDKLPHGLLDNFIYEKVVGERKKTYDEVLAESHMPGGSQRYVHCQKSGKDVFFDVKAYRSFVAMDVVLSALAVNEFAQQNNHQLNFKFLKYGTGYFAGNLKDCLAEHILPGVLDGLEYLFLKNSPLAIKSLEFPFYRLDRASKERLDNLKLQFGISYIVSHDDALKSTVPGLITATTNCGDPHAPCGNEMGFHSVDGAISENLQSKGNIYNPCLNKLIQSSFVPIQIVPINFNQP